MSTKVSATEAARTFSKILSRVQYRGEVFTVVRAGEAVARIDQPPRCEKATVGDLLAALEQDAKGDERFADDLERIQADGSNPPSDPWAA